MKEELKPCPFCGETPNTTKHFREDMWRMVHRCEVIGAVVIEWTCPEERIAAKWNQRAND